MKDGKVIHEGIKKLLKNRQKHYLSKYLLEGESIGTFLTEESLSKILSRFQTLEELAAATEEDLTLLGIASHFAPAILGEAKQLVKKLN